MKKIVFCCLVITLFYSCNWGSCYKSFDDPPYTCALFVTNSTDYSINITHISQRFVISNINVSPNDTCRLSAEYEIIDSSNTFQNALKYILKHGYDDTLFVKNKETGDTLLTYTYTDTNKYNTNFFNPSDWQYLGAEDDCGIIRASFLFEIKE